jgi:hypothetical protein
MKTIIVLILIISSYSLHSQPTIEWVRTLDGTGHGNDGIFNIVNDAAGNVYVTGGVQNTGTGSGIFTARYSSSGQLLWMKTYISNTDDWLVKTILDEMGNIYVGGNSQDGNYNVNSFIIKYSNDGNEVFSRRYFNRQGDRLQMFDLDIDIFHNIYFTGHKVYHYDSTNCFVFKLNSSGDSLWCRSFPRIGNASTFGSRLKVTLTGNVYVAGDAALYFGNSTYLLLKYDNDGTLLWSNFRNEFDYFGALAMTIDADENIYFSSQENVNWVGKSHIKKMNPSGSLLWDYIYYGDSLFHTYIWHLSFDKSNSLIATGNENDGSLDKSMITKFTQEGGIVWYRVLDSVGADYHVTDTSNNIYVIASGSSATHIPLGILYKIDKTGVISWETRYAGPFSIGAGYHDVNIFPDMQSIYVGGNSRNQSSDWDCLIVKYNQLIGIQQISNEVPKSFSLSQNYPNPFNPSTKIKFDIPLSGGVRSMLTQLKIYDITGRQIAVLVNEPLSPGQYEVTFDASAYSSGVYIYRIEAGEYTASKKMLLIK